MKRKLSTILFGLVFLVGFGIFAYPTVSDQWNRYRQNQLISNYTDIVSNMTEADFDAEWESARQLNDTIVSNVFTGDVFNDTDEELKGTPYWDVLNIADDGVMGYISIPKINQDIPIYHGTSDKVLQKGAGHLSGTKLPIGGSGTHSVLAAHRGLPSAKLFSDVDKLKAGDKFYIHVLDEVLAYEVDQILPMVEKDDLDTLTSALKIEEGKDYVTLFTCTPYGVNSHRLLVRGHRTEYLGEDEKDDTPSETMVKAIQNYYMLYGVLAAAIGLLIVVSVRLRRRLKNKNSVKPKEEG